MKLQINNLSKTYSNGVKALDNLNLEIGSGMFGLLGPNGAGKSSLMRTIATLQKPDSGSIEFDGINVLENQMDLRKVLGYLPQEFGVYPNMSAENLLDYFARLKGISSKKDSFGNLTPTFVISDTLFCKFFSIFCISCKKNVFPV